MSALTRLQEKDLSLARRLMWCAVLAVVPVFAFSLFQPDPYFPDEYAHYDVMASVAGGNLPQRFAQASGQTADLFACTELRLGAPLLCGQDGQDASRLPWSGENAASAAAVFFHVAEGRAAAWMAQTADVSLIGVLRGISVAWTIALALIAVWLATLLGAQGAVSVAAGLLCILNPLVLAQSAVIQTDVPAACLALAALAAALVGLPNFRVAVTSYTLATLGLLTRWSALLAPLALVALQWSSGPRRTRALRCLVPLVPVIVAGLLVALDSALRAGLVTNGLQDQYVRENWDQNPFAAVLQAWIRIPVTLSYPFASSPVRPGAGLLALVWAGVVLTTLWALVALWRSDHVLPQRWHALASATVTYLIAMPVITIVSLMTLGIPLFHQPRYLLPGVLLALVLMASSTRMARFYIALAGALWVTTTGVILLS